MGFALKEVKMQGLWDEGTRRLRQAAHLMKIPRILVPQSHKSLSPGVLRRGTFPNTPNRLRPCDNPDKCPPSANP
jgi:hypothetical protein